MYLTGISSLDNVRNDVLLFFYSNVRNDILLFFLFNSAYASDLIRACECRMFLADNDTPEINCKFVCSRARSVARVNKSLSWGD